MECINGWTKKTMIKHIKDNFKGKSIYSVWCAYRGSEGTKCAVGMFIPDEIYSYTMEQLTYSDLLDGFPEVSSFVPLEDMRGLQDAHDNSLPQCTLSDMLSYIKAHVE